jgi:hypothetical protein
MKIDLENFDAAQVQYFGVTETQSNTQVILGVWKRLHLGMVRCSAGANAELTEPFRICVVQ